MTTALDYILGTLRLPGYREKLNAESIALALVEFGQLRAVEDAARLYIEKPSPRTKALLREAVELLPAEVGA